MILLYIRYIFHQKRIVRIIVKPRLQVVTDFYQHQGIENDVVIRIKCQQFHELTVFFFKKKTLYTISHAIDIFSLIRKSFYTKVLIVKTI